MTWNGAQDTRLAVMLITTRPIPTLLMYFWFNCRHAYYFVGIGAAVLLLGTFQVMLFLLTAAKQTKRIREKYFHAILHQPMAWFDTHQIGVLNTRLTE